MGPQTLMGSPIAWVNNQFRQYVYDVSSIVNDGAFSGDDTNLTVSFEAASTYGLNVSTLPDMEYFPLGLSIVCDQYVGHDRPF